MSGQRADCIADTSAIIRLSRREPKTAAVMSGRNFALTFVTAAELLVGIHKAREFGPAFRRIEPITRGRPIFYATEETVSLYAELLCNLEQRGERIPTNDIWIAAIALEKDLPLIARDAHFARVDGLTVIAC